MKISGNFVTVTAELQFSLLFGALFLCCPTSCPILLVLLIPPGSVIVSPQATTVLIKCCKTIQVSTATVVVPFLCDAPLRPVTAEKDFA